MLLEMTMTAAQGWVLIMVTFFTGMTGLVSLWLTKQTKDEGSKTNQAVNGHLAALEVKEANARKDREHEHEKMIREIKTAGIAAAQAAFEAGKVAHARDVAVVDSKVAAANGGSTPAKVEVVQPEGRTVPVSVKKP